ncbi:ribulose-phosphate 3-epimerase [Salimicrobium jeotgali]|uniref:Ribulose-phosphate 3-epimerase n=1 Tax=Salimicrobium jeotgali TaxID=1230341 RepID=K2FLK6_9BACI|nr:ribulose-phosphate 3-epimerase [Salimicrobium jeotgali]AKG04621.1 ribulose-phosphate 3-epimerase [Salimicrobium jeotgali]EKE31886.1 ribulose-phosphate 3-epimerase [Salimicrobium jeotgali]MBM7696151.1 ribulose-phosphate 3-epimerase [Salimicrobium jeotgali]
MTKLAPSILASDFANLESEIKEVEQAGADYIHVDVMDGKFVPNISIGIPVVKAIRPVTDLPLDVHLMISDPENYVEAFAEAGASIITVHQEATSHLHRTIQLIKNSGTKAGVVINPATPVEMLKPILHEVELVLVMSVNPGFGGQKFIPEVMEKVEKLYTWRKEMNNYSYEIEVDGGVNKETSGLCKQAGADVLVAGSAIFNDRDREKAVSEIRDS